MKRLIYTSIIIVSLFMAYFYLKQDFKHSPPTIYTNGNIITLNESSPVSQAMFVKDGIIVAIGSNNEIKQYVLARTKTVNLKGATVMPGFIDPHTHFSLSMFLSEMIDLSGFKHQSNKAVWEHFELEAKTLKKGEWVIAKGLDPVLVKDLEPPTLKYLDKIAPENPVIIFSQSLHSYWVNSKAYSIVGITKNTPNPTKQSYYAKNENGDFNGLIVEQEAIKPFTAFLKAEVITPKKLSHLAEKTMLEYAKNGNTTIVSTGITITDSKPLMLFDHLSNNATTVIGNALHLIGLFPERQPNPRHFIYMRHDRVHLLPKQKKEPNDFYNIIGVKHWYDGSPYIGSMFLKDDYLNSELSNNKLNIPKHHHGEALVNKHDLKEFIKEFHSRNYQIAIHAQGDAANKDVLEAYNELSNVLDYTDTRHRLEHCLLLSFSDLDKMKALNITPSFHINHLYYYGDALKSELLGQERTEKILPIASTKEKGIKFSLHADQPMFESKPFRLIQTAIERRTITGDTIGANQTITLTEAIKALTIDAAWQINMEQKIGSLEQGKYADFIILNKNPFKISTSKLETIKCLKTYVNGNLVNVTNKN